MMHSNRTGAARALRGFEKMPRAAICFGFLSLAIFAGIADAQFGRGGAEWMTDGSDAQRSHWIPADAQISPDSVRGFQFLWKTKLNNESVQLNSLTPAMLLDRYIGY